MIDPAIRDLAVAIAGDPNPPAPITYRRATVQSVDAATGLATIRLAGSTVDLAGVTCLTPVVATDVVNVAVVGQVPLVLGHDAGPWRAIGAAGQPAFENSWANAGAGYVPTRFRKAGGIVHLEVSAGGGNLGATMFTLPAGCRPSHPLRPPAAIFDGGAHYHGMLYITDAGLVQLSAAGGPVNPISEANAVVSFPADS